MYSIIWSIVEGIMVTVSASSGNSVYVKIIDSPSSPGRLFMLLFP